MDSGTRSVILALVVALGACGDGPVAPEDIAKALTVELQTQNIVFRWSAGDGVDADWQQSFHDWTTGLLGVALPAKLRYYKYTGRSQIQAITGHSTNGFAEPDVYTVHSVFPRDGHEAVHVYTALIGRPSDFFNEGIAVALNVEPGSSVWSPPWNGTHVYAHTRLLVETNRLRPLSTIITTSDFRDVDEWTGYGEAGSFLLFMIEQHGIDRMVAFFRAGARNDSLPRIEDNIRAVWGVSLAEAEAAWLAYVDGWAG